MRRRLQENRTRAIVDLAKRELRQGQRHETAASGGGGGEMNSAGSAPLHDPDGVLYDMCGVSVCGGPVVTGP